MRKLSVMAMLAATTMLSGCGLLLIGGAGAGGYYVGKDDRSASVIAEDTAITTKIKSRYVADERIRSLDIHVSTHDGIVTLTGKVYGRDIEERAVDLARTTEGVRYVEDKLTVK